VDGRVALTARAGADLAELVHQPGQLVDKRRRQPARGPGRRRYTVKFKPSIIAIVGVLLVGGCTAKAASQSSDAIASPSASSTSSTSSATPATSTSNRRSSDPAPADGRHPVYLTRLDLSRRTVTFDLIMFLTGKQAEEAWKKAHPEDPEGPPNDYMIVNDNQLLRTLPIAAQAQVTVADSGADKMVNVPIALADLPKHLEKQQPVAGDRRLSYAPYWLTVGHGQVIRIEEQFVP
jgi:hypothetical protein